MLRNDLLLIYFVVAAIVIVAIATAGIVLIRTGRKAVRSARQVAHRAEVLDDHGASWATSGVAQVSDSDPGPEESALLPRKSG